MGFVLLSLQVLDDIIMGTTPYGNENEVNASHAQRSAASQQAMPLEFGLMGQQHRPVDLEEGGWTAPSADAAALGFSSLWTPTGPYGIPMPGVGRSEGPGVPGLTPGAPMRTAGLWNQSGGPLGAPEQHQQQNDIADEARPLDNFPTSRQDLPY